MTTRLLDLACESCGAAWTAARADCVYERLAVASCPCPKCGAYTLCLRDPRPPAGRRRVRLDDRAKILRNFPYEVEIRRAAG
jgi:hypothetical protein